jgi:hypothetical protein
MMNLPNTPAITALTEGGQRETFEVAGQAQRLLSGGQDLAQLSDQQVFALCIVLEAQLHAAMSEHIARMAQRTQQ